MREGCVAIPAFIPVPSFRHQVLKPEMKAEINRSLVLSFSRFRHPHRGDGDAEGILGFS